MVRQASRAMTFTESELRGRSARWRRDNAVPGIVVGVVDGRDLVWSWADGWSDALDRVQMREDALFRIGSITKTFVGTALLQLRDEGALRLDDPLVQYLPAARMIANPYGHSEDITLRDMLQHTAGFPREVPVRDVEGRIALSNMDFLKALGGMELVRPPRTGHHYSNVAYRLLGFVVEVVTDRSFADYCDRHILEPLGMVDTTSNPTGSLFDRVVPGHWARDEFGPPRRHEPMDPARTGGEGALFSSLMDMGRWASQQLRSGPDQFRGAGQVLDGSTLEESHRPYIVADSSGSTYWGLGWSTVIRRGACTFHGHNGSFAGHQAYVGFCAEHDHGAVVLTNGHTLARPAVELCAELLSATRSHAHGADGPSQTAAKDLSEFTGSYFWPELAALTLLRVDGSQLVSSDGAVVSRLVATRDDADVFRYVSGPNRGEFVRFFRNEEGHVIAANLAGYTFHRREEGAIR